jgi:hypothetical protein
MKQITIHTIFTSIVFYALINCGSRLEEKGFAVSPTVTKDEKKIDGISKDSLIFPTKPSNVLLTGYRPPLYSILVRS